MKRLLLFFVFVVALGGMLGGAFVLFVYFGQDVDPALLEVRARNLDIYDKDDKLILDRRTSYRTELSALAEHTPRAFISVEDKTFYDHHGLNPRRVVKALYNNVRTGYAKEGASTITQQLVKNTHLDHEKTLARKLKEAALAIKLERKYSKDEILEMYLDIIYFGNGVYGLEGAARYYFDKEASKLTVSESAALAGMIKSPARYCPYANFENFATRGELVAGLMGEQWQGITVHKTQGTMHNDKYKAAAVSEAGRLLNLSQSDIAAFGYRIYTNFCAEAQGSVMAAVADPGYRAASLASEASGCVVVVSDVRGRVRGYYASHATLHNARRNFASVMKPLVVYVPALELGVVSPATYIQDEPYAAQGFNPTNHDGKFRGLVSVRESIRRSYNLPAVRVLDYTTIPKAKSVASRMGLALGDENLSLALGNASEGTSFAEVVAGYACIANGGFPVDVSFVRLIKDRGGKVVYESSAEHTVRAISEDTAYLVTDCLRDAVRDGTARRLGTLDFDVAAKTGTAERGGSSLNNTDAACVAYTPEVVVLVWRGNVDMAPENDLPRGTTGGGVCALMARDIVGSGKLNVESKFARPSCVVELDIDLAEAKAGRMRLVHTETPVADRGRELFAKRYAPAQASAKFLVAKAAKLEGRVGDAGGPMLKFGACASHSYEIWKREARRKVCKR